MNWGNGIWTKTDAVNSAEQGYWAVLIQTPAHGDRKDSLFLYIPVQRMREPHRCRTIPVRYELLIEAGIVDENCVRGRPLIEK